MRTPLYFARAALLLPTISMADDLPGDPVRGRVLAENVCNACHTVEKGRRHQGKIGAPAFQNIADNSTMTPLALRFILQSAEKDRMPNLILSQDETDDIIAYIRSLRGET